MVDPLRTPVTNTVGSHVVRSAGRSEGWRYKERVGSRLWVAVQTSHLHNLRAAPCLVTGGLSV